MPRVPYVPIDLEEPRELVAAIRARRGGQLSHLDRLLLHSPQLASGWNTFLGAVRMRLSLPPRLRELAICSVAVLNGAEYEFFHHAPEFLKAGGTQAQVNAMHDVESAAGNLKLFDDAERAALSMSLEMTRSVTVNEETFAKALKALGSQQHVIELIAVIAAYNMVSRFLVALDVEPESHYNKLHAAVARRESLLHGPKSEPEARGDFPGGRRNEQFQGCRRADPHFPVRGQRAHQTPGIGPGRSAVSPHDAIRKTDE
jgi:alkylhydroperoxidase family enzyme